MTAPACVFCGNPCERWSPESEGYGNNPEPLAEFQQRCCNDCNMRLVVPARLALGSQNRAEYERIERLAQRAARADS